MPKGDNNTDPSYHRITNADLEQQIGDCSICGPGVDLHVEHRSNGVIKRRCASPSKPGSRARPNVVPLRATLAEVQQARDAQAGKCGICGKVRVLVRDHDHADGHFRAWLCRDCNFGLGFFTDSPERLRAAAHYLETH